MDPAGATTQALQDTDEYLFLDPRQPRSSQPGTGKAKRMVHAEAVVFIVGGGGYVEYTNLMEWATRASGTGSGTAKKVTYGSTEILDPDEFLSVLETLGAS
jgi:hypothetical protein